MNGGIDEGKPSQAKKPVRPFCMVLYVFKGDVNEQCKLSRENKLDWGCVFAGEIAVIIGQILIACRCGSRLALGLGRRPSLSHQQLEFDSVTARANVS